MSGGGAVLRAEGLTKSYPAVGAGRRGQLELFRGLDLVIAAGEMVAIVGQSGAGKSSLLHLLAALDRPTSGEVWWGEQRVGALAGSKVAAVRNRTVGYLWQFHYLLPEFSAIENVALPLLARGVGAGAARERAAEWLQQVGLRERAEHRSGELSGGEQQRVSLARALVVEPQILLADEPTGDLDERTAEEMFGLLERMHRERRLATVLVTHNLGIATRCDRVMELREARLEAWEGRRGRSGLDVTFG